MPILRGVSLKSTDIYSSRVMKVEEEKEGEEGGEEEEEVEVFAHG